MTKDKRPGFNGHGEILFSYREGLGLTLSILPGLDITVGCLTHISYQHPSTVPRNIFKTTHMRRVICEYQTGLQTAWNLKYVLWFKLFTSYRSYFSIITNPTNLSTAMLTRLKTEMLVRQESMISQVSHRGVPSNNLAMVFMMMMMMRRRRRRAMGIMVGTYK